MRNIFLLVAFCVLLVSSTQAFATDWYIDGLNGNDNAAGSKAAPFHNTWRGAQFAKAGDTIHLLPTTVYDGISIGKSGTATAYITLTGDGVAPNRTKIKTSGTDFGIQVNGGATYINITNFDVQATGSWYGIYVGDNSHHVTIANNNVHDSGNGGIATTRADYITIKNNTVYGSCFDTTKGTYGSAISTYENTDIDTNTGIKMIIDGNIVYNNANVRTGGNNNPDGSGIILDDLRHGQSDKVVYKGRTLVQNNIIYGNGGRGISLYNSDHATVISNTVFHNNQDPYESSWRPGEIMVDNGGGDIYIYNNILYSDGAAGTSSTGAHVSLSVNRATDGVGAVTADYNMLFNSKNQAGLMYYAGTDSGHTNTNTVTFSAHNVWGDPLFITPSLDPTHADFHLQGTSPARNAGLINTVSAFAIDGTTRAASGPVDIGAYQSKVTALTVVAVVSGDAYLLNPIVGLVVNGHLMSQATVTANHSQGLWQTVTFTIPVTGTINNFGLSFLNDAWGGVGLDRNLYIQSVTANGKAISLNYGTFVTAKGIASIGQSLLYTNGTLTWTAALLP